MNGARFIRHDLSLVVSELLEEQEEYHKRHEGGVRVPALQLADIDFSYGPVQVLFDVNFEVQKGETLALLGTNGAGKSTILRVISGLEVPERGVVRLNGQNITYVTPEARARLGIIQLPGGKGVFPGLSVEQNLAISARLLEKSGSDPKSVADTCSICCPSSTPSTTRPRPACRVASNRCWPWRVSCCTSPEILLIDELSLGPRARRRANDSSWWSSVSRARARP